MSERIKATLGELVTAEDALKRVLAVKFDQAAGAKVRYHAVKLARLVAAETAHYYEERNGYITEHGEGTPPSIVSTSPAFWPFLAFEQQLRALPIEIAWGPLTDVMLEPYTDITGEVLFGLGPLFAFADTSVEASSETVN